jgi:hypothetical protein
MMHGMTDLDALSILPITVDGRATAWLYVSDGTVLPVVRGGDGPDDGKGGADGGDPPAGGGKPDDGGDGGDAGADGKPAGDGKVEMTQADLDALIEKRLGRAKSQWEKDAKTAADREKLDEVERLKAENGDKDKAIEESKRDALAARVEVAAERAALAAGVKPDRSARFLRLVDLSDLDDLTADGKPDTDAIKALVEKELAGVPEFKGTAAPPGSSGGEHNGGGEKKTWTRSEIASLSEADFDKHEKDIRAAIAEGRVKD